MLYLFKLQNFRFTNHISIKYFSKSADSNLINLLKNMPKEKKHIAEAQKQRNKIREKFSKYVPGKVTLQVLGTGAKGAPRSLYIFSDQSRYLFNCGEGTQRLAHEHKMKLAKLEHIFITQPVWKNIGGLPGTALTIQDVGVPQITLHGPPGMEEMFAATRRFVVIKDLTIRMAECGEGKVFEDNVMRVHYVTLIRDKETSSADNSSSLNGSEDDGNGKAIQVGCGEQSDASTSTINNRRSRRRSRSRSRAKSSSPVKEDIEMDDNIDYYAHERKRFRNRSGSRSRSRSSSLDSGRRASPQTVSLQSLSVLQETKETGLAMAYICQLQPRPGALNLDSCVKKGVPPGPLLGKLKNGEDVTLADGTVVKSKDVCEPDDPGPVFIVIDCPSEEYLNSLIKNNRFRKHQAYATCDDDLCRLIIHFTPQHVMEDPRYKMWMDEFSPSTQHLILNDSNTCMGSEAVHRIQHKLNLLSSDMFPLLGDAGSKICEEVDDPSTPAAKKIKCDDACNGVASNTTIPMENMENLSVQSRPATPDQLVIHANTFFSYHLRPNKGLDRSMELALTPKEYITETMNEVGFRNVFYELKKKITEEKGKLSIRPYPRLLFLGTGSCIPNKTRNTSGILLTTSENRHILIDCGEGTYGQIVRFFGREKSDHIMANIDAVYVSHLHADHHIGLIGLLQGREAALKSLNIKKPPVVLFAPKQISSWLNFYDKYFENISSEYRLIPNGDILLNNHTLDEETEQMLFDSLDMADISTCLVRHCPNAFGIRFLHKDGYKIAYSGDTMPTDNLVELGKNSDILIHEATMEDELAHEAVVKMHSTTSQAIEIGKKMEAKNIMLTHFSQRYAKLPRFNNNFSENVGIAFDNMQIRLDELPLVPHLYPALKIMFAEHYEELENKAVKRQLRMEREREASLDRRKRERQKVT